MLGYNQSLEHIRLIEEEGYQLFTFKMRHSDEKKDIKGIGHAVIGRFEEKIEEKNQ